VSEWCGDSEAPTVFAESDRRARKPHRCDCCHEAIAPGQRYGNTFGVWDGNASTIKRCSRCQAIYDHLCALPGDSEYSVALRLDCGRTYEEEWGAMPLAAQELAFLLPGEQPGRLLPGAPGIGETE
jgi:hypothetical protein